MRLLATQPGHLRWRLTTVALAALLIVLGVGAGPANAALDNGLSGPTEVHFADQVTGRTSLERSVVITATGTAPTTISSVELSGGQVDDFAIVTDTCGGGVLDPAETCSIDVTFTPSTTGAPLTRLLIHADTATGGLDLAAYGIGRIAAITPDKIELGSHVIGTSGSAVATLVNGLDPQSITTINVGWSVVDVPNPFSVRPASGCTALSTIPALGTCEITIDYTPTTVGSVSATLQTMLGFQQIQDALLYGTGLSASGVTWSGKHVVRSTSWTTGNGLARTTKGAAAYLHAVLATDYIGGRLANDTKPHVGIYYRRSTNGGIKWGTPVRLNPTGSNAARGAVAAYGSRVYGVYVTQTKWVKYSKKAPRILYLRVNSKYGSGAWGTAKRLTSKTGRVDYPTVAAAGKHVYVAYTNGATGSIRIAVSHDRGKTFKSKTLGTTTNTMSDGRAGLPSVAASGSSVVVAWTADADGKVLASVSKDAGATWLRSTLSESASGYTAAGAGHDRLSVAWPTAEGASIRTWTPSTWGPIVTAAPPVITGTYGSFDTVAIALSGSTQAGVAWAANRTDPGLSDVTYDLVWSESTDGGATFGHPIVIVAGQSGGDGLPANFSPSVVWGSATQRFVMHAAERFGGGYSVRIRTGTGSP